MRYADTLRLERRGIAHLFHDERPARIRFLTIMLLSGLATILLVILRAGLSEDWGESQRMILAYWYAYPLGILFYALILLGVGLFGMIGSAILQSARKKIVFCDNEIVIQYTRRWREYIERERIRLIAVTSYPDSWAAVEIFLTDKPKRNYRLFGHFHAPGQISDALNTLAERYPVRRKSRPSAEEA